MGPKNSTSRTSASERVEQYIRQSIYNGALKPRERLIEEDLAKQLTCSRGPVREALLRLERDGLIVTLPRRGTFIRDISTESIEVIFGIRGKLEALCVRYLRQQLNPQSEQTLRRALKAMKTAAAEGDEEAFLQADTGAASYHLEARQPRPALQNAEHHHESVHLYGGSGVLNPHASQAAVSKPRKLRRDGADHAIERRGVSGGRLFSTALRKP